MSARAPGQDYPVFTYDDWQSGQASGPYPQPPNHVVSIREHRYKLARYYDADGPVPEQWEMYDLKTDPLERTNLAYRQYQRTPEQEREFRRLQRKLARVEQTRLKPLAKPSRGLPGPATTGRRPSPGRGCRLGLLQFLEQRRQHPHLLGLPVSHERGKPVQAYFGQRLRLSGTGGGERHPARAPVGRVRRHLHQPQLR